MEESVGGYVASWNDSKHFTPKHGEWIVFSHKFEKGWWKGRFNAKKQRVELTLQPYANKRFVTAWEHVDYWMRIPPKPNEYSIPYIIGDDYSVEEKLWTDLATERRQWLEKQRWGVTSEEVAEEVRKTIEIIMKMHKAEFE